MADFTNDEILTMQEDALRRVQEMQRRAQQNIQATNARQRRKPSNRSQPSASNDAPIQNNNPTNEPLHIQKPIEETPPPLLPAEPSVPAEPAVIKPKKASGPLSSILQNLNLDSETIILLVLLFVLIKEGADQSLIFALVYLLI